LEFAQRGAVVRTPVFMPVGTQGSVKGLSSGQLRALGCGILLGNTYHLGHRPGAARMRALGGLHEAMRWRGRAILTDSGGFQMVSLSRLSHVSEEGVRFTSPHDGSEALLTPEASIAQQAAIGSDIAMALDDVVRPQSAPERIAEAAARTVRWLDRCEAVLPRSSPAQALFGIVQGGLDDGLRDVCAAELVRRDLQGYAIGGLSGGEAKGAFWQVVARCAAALPAWKPRYAMGVGYAEDMLVCVALGVDMFDCVFPTRTARFGTALVRDAGCAAGAIDLRSRKYAQDRTLLDAMCTCEACAGGFSRGALHALFTSGQQSACPGEASSAEAVGAQLLSHHNVAHQLRLMADARAAIVSGSFSAFVVQYMLARYGGAHAVPRWIIDALTFAGISFPS
jgi:queuine tRNA-ribosyltransferase